jgi:hypothetical protein
MGFSTEAERFHFDVINLKGHFEIRMHRGGSA